ncbi:MAG: hypothetical protein NTX59_00475 [Elusimicrobia bacterium]|nr:hypothetical protein [Elusimicrobiota bacterium]
MNELIKKITAMNILIAAVLCLGGPASASEFNLSSVSADNLRGTEFKAAPVPLPRVHKAAPNELIGIGLSIRIPFKVINKAMLTEKRLSLINPAAPALERSGEMLKVVNIRLNINGIIIKPVITLKPYLEDKDKLAVKVQRVQLHASGSPTPGSIGLPAALPTPDTGPGFNTENTMADVMGIITDAIREAINESLAANHSSLSADDLIVSRYDKAAWTLHSVISTAVLKRVLPENLVGEVHLTGFRFDDSSLIVELTTGN